MKIYSLVLNPSIDYYMEVNLMKIGETNRSIKEYSEIGGKGINVSKVLSVLDKKSTLIGFIGGYTGDYIISEIQKDNYITSKFIQINNPSRINIKLNNLLETEINSVGPNIEPRELDILEQQIKEINPGDIIILTGSVANGMDEDWYLKIVKDLSEKKALIIIDVPYKIIKYCCKFKPFLIKPNKKELEIIFDTKINTEEEIIVYGKKLIKFGAQKCIISLGKEGSIYLDEKNVYKAEPYEVITEGFVGAGDSMVAGFISGYIDGMSDFDAYRQSVACSISTVATENVIDKRSISENINKILIKKY